MVESSSHNDLQNLLARAWKLYNSLTSAPEPLRDLQDAILLVLAPVRQILEYSQDINISSSHLSTLHDHIERVTSVITVVETDLAGLKAKRANISDVTKNSRKLVVQGTRLSSFYELLASDSQARIIQSLTSLHRESSDLTVFGDWDTLSHRLQELGHSESLVEESYFVIHSWLQHRTNSDSLAQGSTSTPSESTISSRNQSTLSLPPGGKHVRDFLPTSSLALPLESPQAEIDNYEELPGYEPTTTSLTIREKAGHLEQTTAISDAQAAVGLLGLSPNIDPPDYTFDGEDGGDNEMDERLAHCIQNAIAIELRRRYKAREINPKQGPFVYSWLPQVMQQKFADQEVVSLLDAASFTVMANETAPRVTSELEELFPILRMSADGSGDDTIFMEAENTIKVMLKAMANFGPIKHPSPGKTLSDLDILDYECDTARAADDTLDFPSQQFRFAQKSYYDLLIYIMGMLDLIKEIFSGHIFVRRSREELVRLCKIHRLSARTAWILKQIAGWRDVDEAILHCRNWQRKASVRDQAIRALERWEDSVGFLLGSVPPSILRVTLHSVSGLHRAHNYRCEFILYNRQLQSGKVYSISRHFEKMTAIAKNTQFPVWDAVYNISLPESPGMIDVLLYETGFRSRQLARWRLTFANIPGVEKSLMGKDLFYGFDEPFSLPAIVSESLKGKEVEGPVLNIRLAWKGRYTMLEEAGLPVNPPGKMFRKTRSPIPLPFASSSGNVALE